MKPSLQKAVNFIALFLLMLVTGVFWGTWFTLTRSIDSFSPAEFIHIGQVIIGNVAVPMRILMPSCILFMILSAWLYPVKRSVGFSLNVTANILIIVTLLITLLVLVPIDNQIRIWTASTTPSDWTLIRDRWQFFHSLRTITSVTAFACLAGSIVYSRMMRGYSEK